LLKTLFVVLAMEVAGCASATPVTPAPLSPADLPQMQAALSGSCLVTTRRLPSGEMRPDNLVRWTFLPGNRIEWRMGYGTNVVNYRLDGRNMFSDGMFKSMRVDAWDATTLTVFIYDISETYFCTRT
jgi:hypothetical protein